MALLPGSSLGARRALSDRRSVLNEGPAGTVSSGCHWCGPVDGFRSMSDQSPLASLAVAAEQPVRVELVPVPQLRLNSCGTVMPNECRLLRSAGLRMAFCQACLLCSKRSFTSRRFASMRASSISAEDTAFFERLLRDILEKWDSMLTRLISEHESVDRQDEQDRAGDGVTSRRRDAERVGVSRQPTLRSEATERAGDGATDELLGPRVAERARSGESGLSEESQGRGVAASPAPQLRARDILRGRRLVRSFGPCPTVSSGRQVPERPRARADRLERVLFELPASEAASEPASEPQRLEERLRLNSLGTVILPDRRLPLVPGAASGKWMAW